MTNKPMTKSQLVANLAESVGSDKASANRMIDALSAIISKEVAAGSCNFTRHRKVFMQSPPRKNG